MVPAVGATTLNMSFAFEGMEANEAAARAAATKIDFLIGLQPWRRSPIGLLHHKPQPA